MTEHEGKHEDTESRRRAPGWMITAVALALLVVGIVVFRIDNDHEEQRADINAQAATSQATTLDRLCATDPDVYRRIPEDCAKAREIREEVVLPATAPGPSQAQVQGWVEDWMEAHPSHDGKNATPEMVARAVAEHMEGNGQAQITKVAQAYLAANAERFRGEPGADGEQGPKGDNATDDQVATAVAAFCAEHGDCAGPQGERGGIGPQGQGVVDAQPIRNGEGTCEWVITLEDPRDGSRSERRYPAGDAACPADAPAPPEETGGGLLGGG